MTSTAQAAARCVECGWPAVSPAATCAACGAAARRGPPTQRGHVDAAALLALHEEDYPGLRDAFGAFRAREWPRFVGASLLALGVDRVHSVSSGPQALWVFRHGSAVIIVTFDKNDQTLALDAPVVDIRAETEAPLLRAALSAGAKLGSARPARRGDRLVLTMTHKVTSLPPPRFCHAVQEIARAADELDNVFAAEFGVRLLGPQMKRGHLYDLDVAGTPHKLAVITGADRPVRMTPSQPADAPAPAAMGSVPSAPVASAGGSITRFLDVVRELQQISIGFGFSPIDDNLEAAFHLAGAYRAALAGGVDLDGARLLVRTAQSARAGKLSAASLRGLYARVLQERGQTAPEAQLALARIPTARVKHALTQHVGAASRAGVTAVKRTLLLGGLAELILAGDLPAPTVTQLRQMHDNTQGTDTHSVEGLFLTLTEMCK